MELIDFVKEIDLQLESRIEVLPKFKTKYITNASESYKINFSPEKIVFIVDDTVFGSGKDGCVVTGTGIAFKSMFLDPVVISFKRIEKITVSGNEVLINNGAYKHTFSLVEKSDIKQVFGSISDWMKNIRSKEVDIEEYQDKVEFIEIKIKELLAPLFREMLSDMDEDDAEEMAEHLSDCLEDIDVFKESVDNEKIQFETTQKIDNVFNLFFELNRVLNEKTNDFDQSLLDFKSHDGNLGKFLKSMFKEIFKSVEENNKKEKKINRLNRYL